MYIYAVRCLYVEFRCICVQFDNFVRNGTPYKYVAFLTGSEDWLSVTRPAKNTLVLIKVLRI